MTAEHITGAIVLVIGIAVIYGGTELPEDERWMGSVLIAVGLILLCLL